MVTGDRAEHPHLLADYASYYRAAKARFEARIDAQAPAAETYPEPVDHCRVCSWWTMCVDRRRADDHLSLVANITRSNRRRLVAAGSTRSRSWRRSRGRRGRETAAEDPRAPPPPGVAPARLPPRRRPPLRAHPAERRRPWPRLRGNAGAIATGRFLRHRGRPWAVDDGLEYLLGWAEAVDGEPVYHAIWGHNRAEEKAAFEQFVDLVQERFARDPTMHVFHYGGYESGALKRLMQRHATREDEVDGLLRGRDLVNLSTTSSGVRSGRRSSRTRSRRSRSSTCPSARAASPTPVSRWSSTSAGWRRRTRRSSTRSPPTTATTASRQPDSATGSRRGASRRLRSTRTASFPARAGVTPSRRPTSPHRRRNCAREDALRLGVPADRADRDDEQQGRWACWPACSTGTGGRPNRSGWDHSTDGGVARRPDRRRVGPRRAGVRRGPRADGQVAGPPLPVRPLAGDEASHVGKSPIGRPATVPARSSGSTRSTGRSTSSGTRADRNPRGLIPSKPYGPEPMRGALGRLADPVVDRGLTEPGPYRAARDLILRRRRGPRSSPRARRLRPPRRDAARRRAPARGYARRERPADPGPPGTGKTYTGARMASRSPPAGSASASSPSRTGSSPTSSRPSPTRQSRQAPGPGGPARRRRRGCIRRTRASGGATEATGGRRPRQRRGGRRRRGEPGLGAERAEGARSTCCSSTQGRPAVAGHRVLRGWRGLARAARRSQPAAPVSQGTHPEGAEASGLEHLLDGARTIAPTVACSSRRPTGSTRP